MKNVYIPWNPDTQSVTVTTNSTAGSNEMVCVEFYEKNGNWDDSHAGSVSIYLYTQIKYSIGLCTYFDSIPSPVILHTDTQKTWTLTYNYTELRLVIHCNEVQVVNVLLSSVCTESSWRRWWEKKPTQIRFSYFDTASDSYCFSSYPGKYNGGSGKRNTACDW